MEGRGATAGSGFLPQIQALRAVAVVAVVAFHLWPERVTGGYVGVDVFFVLSGYLISAHLVTALDDGRFSFPTFWARRARRLLPLSFAVLAAILLVLFVAVPAAAWQQYAREAGAAAAYFLNWRLAADATDYFGAENLASPVQHFWSLSVEEQFYLAWPILLAVCAWTGRRLAGSAHVAMAIGMGAVGAASFGYSIWYSEQSPAAAYFSTFTHAWEFAAGGLAFAVWRGALAPRSGSGAGRAAISWAGLGMIVGACVVFDGATPFPSWRALLPVAGTILVVLAGDARGPIGTASVFGWSLVQRAGDLSYAAYLWHWPMIVLIPVVRGRGLSVIEEVGVFGATFALAAVSKVAIEDPARFSAFIVRLRPSATLTAAAVGSAVIVGSTVLIGELAEDRVASAAEDVADLADRIFAGDAVCFGAGSMAHPETCADRHVLDEDLLLLASTAGEVGSGVDVIVGETLEGTRYGPADAEVTVVLVGDSHARMYREALIPIAARNDWQVLLVWLGDCSPSAPTWESYHSFDNNPKCLDFRERIMTELRGDGADVIVTSSVSPRYANHETPEKQAVIADAYAAMWRAWTDAGVPTVVIADAPGPGPGATECFAENRRVEDPCPRPATEVVELDPMVVAATNSPAPLLHLLDMTDAYCDPAGLCHQVIGGIPVYQGGSHISPGFALSLAPRLQAAVIAALES